jgi:hypothetical protein
MKPFGSPGLSVWRVFREKRDPMQVVAIVRPVGNREWQLERTGATGTATT